MDTAALRPAPQVVISAAPGLRNEQEITAVRAQLTRKSPTYRTLTADPFAVLAPADPELPF
jgi:hypothetical protein